MTRVRAIITGLAVLGTITLAGSCLARPGLQQESSPRAAGAAPGTTTAGSPGALTTGASGGIHAVTPTPSNPTSSAAAAQVTASPGPRTVAPAGDLLRAYVTAYTWYDNDPTGAQIADPVLHRTAGGTGTYADPVTLAVADGAYRAGTRFYLPHVRRYFMVEDTCAACGQRSIWVDMWIDGRSGSATDVQDCASRLTGTYSIELDPPLGRPVDPGPLFSTSGCYTSS